MFWENKEVQIWNRVFEYKNELKQTLYKEPTLEITLMADVQPLSREEVVTMLGVDAEAEYRVFMSYEPKVEGQYIVYKSRQYDIKKVFDWDDYSEVVISERRV